MKVLIIEDEIQTASVLRDIILEIRPEARIVDTLESIKKTVEYLSEEKNQPDIIFMDIQLTDGLSFEIFSQVQIHCPVFLTIPL